MRENILDSANPGKAGAFMCVHHSESCMFAGHGDVFRTFMQTRQLTGYPGEGTTIVAIGDVNYDSAPLKVIRFAQAFKKLPYDASHRKCSCAFCFMYQ